MRGCTSHTRRMAESQTTSLDFPYSFPARSPRPKVSLLKLKGSGRIAKKTHPSGRGRDNFAGVEGGPRIFPKSPQRCFPCPTASRPDLGTRKGQREGRRGRGRAPRPPEAAAKTGIPAWRKRGPAPARGRRRRRAASVHRPRRR